MHLINRSLQSRTLHVVCRMMRSERSHTHSSWSERSYLYKICTCICTVYVHVRTVRLHFCSSCGVPHCDRNVSLPIAAEDKGAGDAPSPAKKPKGGAPPPPGGPVEIAFSFDTTGSMYPCLAQVCYGWVWLAKQSTVVYRVSTCGCLEFAGQKNKTRVGSYIYRKLLVCITFIHVNLGIITNGWAVTQRLTLIWDTTSVHVWLLLWVFSFHG